MITMVGSLKIMKGKRVLFKIDSKDIIFNKPLEKKNVFKFKDVILEVITLRNLKEIKKFKMDNIFAVIKGNICNKSGKNILSSGDIIKTGTLKKLSTRFKIKKYLTLLRVYKIN